MVWRHVVAAVAVAGVLTDGEAQQADAESKPVIPIRQLAPTIYRTTDAVNARNVVALAGGQVLVNLPQQRRVLAFDSTLTTYTVVIDSAAGLANSYSASAFAMMSSLVPFLGDSAIFTDPSTPTSVSLLVLDPAGQVARVMAPPRSQDGSAFIGAFGTGGPRFRPDGKLVHRVAVPLPRPPTPPPTPGAAPTAPQPISLRLADSAALIIVDPDTRTVDTIARVRVPRFDALTAAVRGEDGKLYRTQRLNPVLPAVDEHVVLPDGAIAIVRGVDYHIDWIYPDGTRASTPKMPVDWRRLTDDDKRAKLDSARTIRDSITAARGPQMGGMQSRVDGSGQRVMDTVYVKYEYVSIDEIPDYIPPFRVGSVKADLDGNLWILPTTSLQASGGLLYDVINRKGEITERVQLPAGRDIIGFGRDGVLFLTVYEPGPPPQSHLERARVMRESTSAQ